VSALTSRAFWADAGNRAVRTFAQSELALLTSSGAGLIDAPWWASLSASGMAALLSLLTSVADPNIPKG